MSSPFEILGELKTALTHAPIALALEGGEGGRLTRRPRFQFLGFLVPTIGGDERWKCD